MFLQRGLLPRDHQNAVLLVADADFPGIRLRPNLARQRGNGCGSQGQFQKFATLHHILLNDHGEVHPIIRRQEDGVARQACRVLCKNNNDDTAQRVRGDGFIAESRCNAAHFS